MARKGTTLIAIPDTHWPYQSKPAVAIATKIVEHVRPTTLVHLGDLIDNGPWKRHPNQLIGENQGAEHWVTRQLAPAVDWFRTLSTYATKSVFIEGNHEHWVERACAQSGAAGQAAWPLVNPLKHLKAAIPNLKVCPYMEEWNINTRSAYLPCPNLALIHGWTACRHAAARHLQLSGVRSVIFGHTHRSQRERHSLPWARGRTVSATSPGCLCLPTASYRQGGSPTGWAHGVELVYIGKSGKDFTQYTIDIQGNRAVLPDGTEIKV